MSALQSILKQQLPERKKVKKKMSKAQMQLAIIKKKQCDANALVIVEQLLEPKVDDQWLLQNLGYINKSHMEDVIEERAIIKLCGYVLCSNTLTTIITQRYYISTKKNKVYDVTRRKNFCSSLCYGACNYLLEQMLTSPLWLREKEEIPTFRFLAVPNELERCTPGEEIHVGGPDVPLNLDKTEEPTESNCVQLNTDRSSRMEVVQNERELTLSMDYKEDSLENPSINEKLVTKSVERVRDDDAIKETCSFANIVAQESTNEQDSEKIIDTTFLNDKTSSYKEEHCIKLNEGSDNRVDELSELGSDDTAMKQNPKRTQNNMDHTKDTVKYKRTKCSKNKEKNLEPKQSCEFFSLAMHIEQNVKEWMTENTLCLLSGEENVKNRLLENVTQQDKYLQLCKKLNKLQLEDGKEDRADLSNSTLKPLPHLAALAEEAKKMELKVRAFYKGSVILEPPKTFVEGTDEKDSNPRLPLTDAHAPKALRRRILLDKLDRILPDLLRALADNSHTQYVYSSERSILIKALVNTFALSATNITFKIAEWTLVGLIFIKMLSIIDPSLKLLLATRQASMYVSMILMSYKLDSNYLDRFVIELTNNPEIFNTECNTNL